METPPETGTTLSKQQQPGALTGHDLFQMVKGPLKIKGFTDVWPQDALPVEELVSKLEECNPQEPLSLIVNTGGWRENGEHWQVLWFSPSEVKGVQGCWARACHFFDSYGLPPMIQDKVWELIQRTSLKECGGGELSWPDWGVQEKGSTTCGYHCLFYLKCKDLWPEEDMETLLNAFYHKSNLKLNDEFVVKWVNKMCKI